MELVKKVCPKCQHDTFHSPFGCLHGSSLDGSLCKCKLDDNDVDMEILKARIEALETDLIHVRRVADERQEIIDELKAALRPFAVECPWSFDDATIPKAGIDAAPEQVVCEMSVGWPRILKARKVLGIETGIP